MDTFRSMAWKIQAVLILGIVALVLFAAAQQKTPKQNQKAQAKEVQLGAGDTFSGPARPVVVLAEALRKDKKSTRFRVTWGTIVLSFNSTSTVLYDRVEHTIKLYSFGGDEMGGYVDHYLYTKVTDDIIFSIADKYKDEDVADPATGPGSFFGELANHGCKSYKLQ